MAAGRSDGEAEYRPPVHIWLALWLVRLPFFPFFSSFCFYSFGSSYLILVLPSPLLPFPCPTFAFPSFFFSFSCVPPPFFSSFFSSYHFSSLSLCLCLCVFLYVSVCLCLSVCLSHSGVTSNFELHFDSRQHSPITWWCPVLCFRVA